jgi:transcriptional regulator with XRE-family HTH domain
MVFSAHPVDIYVGGRLRLRRVMLGLSQQELGNAVGITFQQVQKYEKGVNRIGASRLFEISRVLGTGVEYFFEDLAAAPAGAPLRHGEEQDVAIPLEAMHEDFVYNDGDDSTALGRGDKDILLLIRYYQTIKDPDAKKRTLSLVRGISQLYSQAHHGDKPSSAEAAN